MTQEINNENDNAGHGIRGLRAQPSEELFTTVCNLYGIKLKDGRTDLGGSSSLNLLVVHIEDRYVVRVYRPCVTEARLGNINLARQTLNAYGLPVSQILPTLDKQQWAIFDNRLIEIEKFVASDAYMNSWEHLMAGLPLLGKIHTALKNVQFGKDGKNPLFANHIEPQRTLELTLPGIQRIRQWSRLSKYERLADAAEELAARVSKAERGYLPHLPRQMCHGDYWDNNVFFRDGQVVLVTDFDFMGERARIDDLALTLYYFDCSDNLVTHEHLGKLRCLIDAYDKGLGDPLSEIERKALPLAMARQPLWSIGVWIALLDDEAMAKQHAESIINDINWALRIMSDLDRYQDAFS